MAGFHLADLFEIVARAVPQRSAIVCDGHVTSFAELDERADRVAEGLAARGVGRGDTVGLYLTNCAEHLEAFLAAIKLGAVPFNVNYRYGGDELHYLLDNAQAAAIFHNREFGPLLDELRPRLPTLKLAIAVEDGGKAPLGGSLAYDELVESPLGGPFARDERDILLTYTGGTTGMPKGVMWPHRAFFFACLGGGGHFHPAGPIAAPEEIAGRALEGYQLRLLPVAPLMHAAAVWATWSALLGGLTIVLDRARRFDAARIWDVAERDQVNLVQIVGDAMAGPLRDALEAEPGRWNLAHVVNLGSGGAVFSAHLKDAFKQFLPNATITDGMGSSETGISGMAEPSPDGIMRVAVGPNQQIVVGERLGVPGETGFIARSGNVPIGYWRDSVKSSETFRTIDGTCWAVSGDSGRYDHDQRITVFGRGSTCINTGGEKVFPEEVEEALRAHPAVFDAVVAGQPDPRWGERVVAIAAHRDGLAKPSLDEVRAFLAGRLAGYKLPRALVWVDTVERSPAGKQDYRWAKTVAAGAA